MQRSTMINNRSVARSIGPLCVFFPRAAGLEGAVALNMEGRCWVISLPRKPESKTVQWALRQALKFKVPLEWHENPFGLLISRLSDSQKRQLWSILTEFRRRRLAGKISLTIAWSWLDIFIQQLS